MSVAGVMVLLAVAIGALTFVVWPLVTQPAGTDSMATGQNEPANTALTEKLDALQLSYEQTLGAVRDLEFDFQTGKLTAEDHRQRRAGLMNTAADLLRQIDLASEEVAEAAVNQRRISRATAQQAEAAIAQKRATAKKAKR